MKNILLILVTVIFLASCASQSKTLSQEEIQAQTEQLKASPNTWNTAPTEMFSGFSQFEFNEAQLAQALQSDQKKVASAQLTSQTIANRLEPVFNEWQQQNAEGRTLVIDTTFPEYKIVSKSARIWGGAFAGDSNVKMDVTMTDKSTGAVIAKPFFFQRANAFGAAWTFGSHDNSIAERLATLLEKYMVDNYTALEGGPTGNDK